jgi:hypothetical protein
MLDSDDEDDDSLHSLPPPKAKKRKENNIEDVATGPDDFIKALTEAGFYPRTGNLPNLLSLSYILTGICVIHNNNLFITRCPAV